ncbi:hypothetical protein [Nannocystis sp. SCPEA4]|uniref:hypothetical protein n=1 Tax=Nannocystis sp. SCPEA4 TaxID=2996787 RepID=UPI002270A67F|nr:hypothetical protein [Nannocystis sp. SCPEA4]MCY1059056.1 hypothetical protein [Nannocystis sp. SCPEA4]
MAKSLETLGIGIEPVIPDDLSSRTFDVAVWAASYEARSRWLTTSKFCPSARRWYRIEFTTYRDVLDAPINLELGLGDLLGGRPGNAGWDGYWTNLWREMICVERERIGRPFRIFVDYSSLPKAVYGPLLMEVFGHCRGKVESLSLVYVPGRHAAGVDGSRCIEGIWPLIGTEGRSLHLDSPAFVLGLGYDGILAEAVLDLFRIAHFSCIYADPGVEEGSVARTQEANVGVLERSEIIATCPATSILEACERLEWISEWYRGRRDVVLLPLGPKPHVVAAILVACANPSYGLRFPKVSSLRPVQVTVSDTEHPVGSTLWLP